MMDFELQSTPAVPALPAGTMLHGCYQVLCTVSVDAQSIVYEVQNGSEHTQYIREYCPISLAVRAGTVLSYDEIQKTMFQEGCRKFVKIGRALRRGVPHIVSITDLFSENGTSYIVSDIPAGTPLVGLSGSLTPAYIQDLGIMLCDTLAALHDTGLYYGVIRNTDLCFGENGELLLSSLPISADGSAAQDTHTLRNFLLSLLPSENNDDLTEMHLRKVLVTGCQDARILKKMLLGEKTKVKQRSGIPGLILCAACLAASIVGIQFLPEKEKPLSKGVQNSSVHPDVISVWLPLDETENESEVSAMYERLAAGFERQNPGCGVNILIYADDSFTEALSMLDEAEEIPTVFMDTQESVVQLHAADISSLTAALDDIYTTDLTQFDTMVPLGFSVPALFYNEHHSPDLYTMDMDTTCILFDSLPANTVFDMSAAAFITIQNAAQEPAKQFQNFLKDGHYPVLASSSCIALAERSGISSGAVHMIPVTTESGISLQYEMYCTINKEVSDNSQHIGMLWLQYLLTEEAQQILFVENYNDLPLHKKSLSYTLENHKELQAVESVLYTAIQPEEQEHTGRSVEQ